MPRRDDPYSTDPVQRRASAQRVAAPNRVPQRVAAPQFSASVGQPAAQPALALADILWYSACVVLALACVVTLVYWLWRGINGQVDSTKLAVLVLVVLIYALCIGCGWLWSRSRSAPIQADLEQQVEILQQQVEGFKQRVEYLEQEKVSLQQTLRRQGSVSLPANGGRVSAPQRVPDTSIYDQQVEPADSSDLPLHPHEKRFPMPGEQNALGFNWYILGASRRGYGHGYEGKYREDDFQIKLLNDQAGGPALAVVAVADGVSSKELSRKGALASVEGATALTESQVARLKTLLSRKSNPEDVRMAAMNVLLEALRSAADSVRLAARNARVSVDEMHATLLVFLAAPLGPEQLFLARVQIGDGAMFGVRASVNGGERPDARWQQLLAPQIQAAGNEVQPFMRSQEKDWYQFMQCDILSPLVGVLAMTDGIADDVEPPLPAPGEPEPDHFVMVDRFHRTYVVPTLQSPRPADELVKYIGYRRSQSIDDRTLIYLYRK